MATRYYIQAGATLKITSADSGTNSYASPKAATVYQAIGIAANIINNPDWETGAATCVLNITTGSTSVTMRARIERRSSAAVLIEASDWSSGVVASAGSKTFNIASKNWSAGSVGDRLYLYLEYVNSSHGNLTIEFSYSSGASYVDSEVSYNLPPTIQLDTADDTEFTATNLPSLLFTGTDSEADEITYELKIYISGLTSPSYAASFLSLCSDGSYLYGGGYGGWTVKKYSLADLSVLATSPSYGGNVFAITADDDYVYVVGGTTNTVRKYNKSDLTYTSVESPSYGGTIYGIVDDDNYVYIGGGTTFTVRKYNKSDLTYTSVESSSIGTINKLVIDGDYIYVAYSSYVKKLNKSDLTTVATSPSTGGLIYGLVVDGDEVYASSGTTFTVRKYNKSDLTYTSVESPSYGNLPTGLATDSDYVYVGGYSTETVRKYNKSDLSYTSIESAVYGSIDEIVVLNGFVYVAGDANTIVRYFAETLEYDFLLEFASDTDSGFENVDTPADTDPFNSADQIKFTVQAGDELDNGEYLWTVRASDPTGSTVWSAWATARAFTINFVDVGLEATINSSSEVTATLKAKGKLQASIDSSSAVTGTMRFLPVLISSAIDASSTLVSVLKAKGKLISSIDGASSTTAVIKGRGKLLSTIDASSSVTAELSTEVTTEATIDCSSSLAAMLIAKRRGVAQIDGSSAVAATLSGIGDLDSAIAAASSLIAELKAKIKGTSQIDVSSSVTALLKGKGKLIATISANSDLIASLTSRIYAIVSIDGSTYVSATIKGMGRISSSIDTSSILTATISALCHIDASIDGGSSIDSILKAYGKIAATMENASSVEAILTALGRLSVQIDGGSSVEGILISLAEGLEAMINTSSDVTATLRAWGNMMVEPPIFSTSDVLALLTGTANCYALIETSSVLEGILTAKAAKVYISSTIACTSVLIAVLARQMVGKLKHFKDGEWVACPLKDKVKTGDWKAYPLKDDY